MRDVAHLSWQISYVELHISVKESVLCCDCVAAICQGLSYFNDGSDLLNRDREKDLKTQVCSIYNRRRVQETKNTFRTAKCSPPFKSVISIFCTGIHGESVRSKLVV